MIASIVYVIFSRASDLISSFHPFVINRDQCGQ